MAAFSVLEQIELAQKPLTVAQLAKIFGKPRQSIYNGIKAGKIPVIDDGLPGTRIDPRSLAFQLRRNNPAMRLAAATPR